MSDGIVVDPEALRAAAAQLENAAGLLEGAARLQATLMAPAAAGGEEVSALAARYFSSAAESHGRSVARAVAELRETGAVLRSEADGYVATDDAGAAAIGGRA